MATPPDGKKRRSPPSNKKHTNATVTVHCDDEFDHGSVLTTTNTEPSTPPSDKSKSRTSSSSRESSKLTLDEEVLKEDMLVITTYVKEEMYYGVKFVYDAKLDLAIGEQIFNHFHRTCKKRLEGLKKYERQQEKELYIRYVWKHAMDERVQLDALSAKRSSVYTVMQNRFFCKWPA